jgi:hypothetical protein
MIPAASVAQDRTGPRAAVCTYTRLTKPECHCRACLFDQIATHAPAAARVEPRAA